MKKIQVVLTVYGLFLISATIFAQPSISLKKLFSTEKHYDIAFPSMSDSLNLKGEKFDNKKMLETFISFPQETSFTNILSPDISGYFLLSKARNEARFYLLSFDLDVDRFSQTIVKITAPSLFEAYINGVKETSKTSIEDTLTSAKTVQLNFPANPGNYHLLIKYLSLASNKSPEGIKITVEPKNENSKAQYTLADPTEKRNVNIRDILEGTRLASSSISPDGNFVLLQYSTTEKDGKQTTSKELFSLKDGRKIALSKNMGYRWMPSQNKFYYTLKNDKTTELIAVDPESLTEETLADNIPDGWFSFTPNEKTLIYMDEEKPEPEKKDLILLQSPEDRQPNARNRYFLSKYDLASGVKQRITFGKESTFMNDISLDSRFILYTVRQYTPTQRPFFRSTLLRMDLQSLQVDTIWKNEAFVNDADFSPDGKKILITGSAEAFGGIGNTLKEGQIPNSYNTIAFIMNLADRKIEAITKNFNPSIEKTYWNMSDGMIYLKATDKDFVRMYRYDPDKKNFRHMNLNEDVVRKIYFASKKTVASYIGVGQSNSTRSYMLDLKNDKSTLIADPYKDRLAELNLAKVKDWTFVSSDSTTIDGRFYLPPNFDSSKKYPMIVYYYGGTTPTTRTFEAPYPAHVYASLGYIVYVLQPSGTIGYGPEFAARHVNAWGKRTADDIIEGTKQFIREHSYVDEKKIGCIGASYGGFMTLYLQTRTNLFTAAVSHAGISSISSYWGEGYWGYTYSSVASAGSYPWNNSKMYVEQSPLFNAEKINTPILLLHGTADTNVPIGESIQMYTALKILGKPVEFIQIKGENHGIKDFKKRIEWNNSIFAWFAKWLQDDDSWWNNLYPNNK